MNTLIRQKDTRWLLIWLCSLSILAIWDTLFLNHPAFFKIIAGFSNTMFIALLVVIFTLIFAWLATLALHTFESRRTLRPLYLFLTFIFNCIRSVPQIVGVLFAYVGVNALHESGFLVSSFSIFLLMAPLLSLFIFLELVDLMRERIDHFRKLDFFHAMEVCGISESRIVNIDILWKNSRIHIFNKLVSVFGMAVFLQCSVDFIISVGLSTDVNQVSLPTTLGSMLASIDSKQDILSIGYTLTHPLYIGNLFFRHLQGMSVAFCLVITLVCMYNIASGIVRRHRL